MENEINCQKDIILKLADKYIIGDDIILDVPKEVSEIKIIASGSSHNAALVGKYFFESISDIASSTEFAAEFANSKLRTFDKNTLYIFISQSGNSVDTVLSLEKVKAENIKTLCITNNLNSKMNALADFKIDIMAGIEQAIAATKTFSSTVFVLYLMALKFAKNKGVSIQNKLEELKNIVDDIDLEPIGIERASELIANENDFSLCGFNVTYPLALEAALKIKETSYINTSSYPTGEFIHGHFAILNKSKVLLAFLKDGFNDVEKKLLEKIQSTYNPNMVVITDSNLKFEYQIKVKKAKNEAITIINMIITLQKLALNIATILKKDVDKPVGLNKVIQDVLKDN